MLKNYLTAAVQCAAIWCVLIGVSTSPVFAGDNSYSVTANIGLDSVSVFRGNRSRELNPSVSGGFDIDYGDYYGGVYSSPVSFEEGTRALVLGYVGYAPSALGLDFNVGARYFAFPNSEKLNIDLNDDGVIDQSGKKGVFEGFVGAKKSVGPADIALRVFYSPQFFGQTGDGVYATASTSFDLPHKFKLRAKYARSEFANDLINDDYADYAISIERSVMGLDLRLAYSDTIGSIGPDDSVVVFGVVKEFGIASDKMAYERRYRKIRNNWIIDKSALGFTR